LDALNLFAPDRDEPAGTGRQTMADRKSLRFIGLLFGAITAVMATGIVVVQRHLDGRMMLDEGQRPVVSASLPTFVR
jgi:hypothetical protein